MIAQKNAIYCIHPQYFKVNICALLHMFLSPCSAQAPGDEDNRCTVDHTSPQVYPDTVRNLMDSYNYEQLLSGNGTGNPVIQGAVWNDRSYDGNDEINRNSPTYWQHGAGGICRYQTTVCGYRREGTPQSNWLFTQHIRKDFNPNIYNYPVEIHVEITHALRSCRERLGCNPRVYVHNYITNSMQLPSTLASGFMNTQLYRNIGVLQPSEVSLTFVVTLNFTLQPSQIGFYIAVQDNGTCAGISRIRVYRENCISFQRGLVLYPDAPAPVSDPVNINIQCVDNAVVSGSARVTCGSDGRWGPQNPVCQCRLGYEDRGTECVACPAGEYRSAVDSTCQQCPDNTVRDQVAAPLCACLDGYFRTATELASKECTQPPNEPLEVSLNPQTNSITVSWRRPADLGGRSDLFYQVEHSDPDDFGSYITDTANLSGSPSRPSYTVTGLRPYTQYCVRVTAHNGVSDQDPDGIHLRTVEECVRTDEGTPGVVTGLQGRHPYVVWNPPEEPNGVITGYRLRITRSSTTRTITTNNDQTYYVIQSSDIPGTSGPFTVTVAARTSAGIGLPSQSFTFTIDEANPPTCPTCPTSPSCPTCPTCATCPDCDVCPAQSVGLVHYPATPARNSGSQTVTTQCADNASPTTGLSVTCRSDGSWSGSPQCQCNSGYQTATIDRRQVCLAFCEAQNVDLVRYPRMLAPSSGSTTVTAQCADNAHRVSSSLSVSCSSTGSWSGSPRCQCNDGYQTANDNGRQICQAIGTCPPPMLCPGQSVGLVRYPATQAPNSGSTTVTAQCADNARRVSSSLSVTCSSTDSWSGSPRCQCNSGYETATIDGRQVCLEFCEAQNVDLVRYPKTLAPNSGSQTVTAQCADNASPATSLSVMCHSDGTWSSSNTLKCQCNTGYKAVSDNGREFCQASDECSNETSVEDAKILSAGYAYLIWEATIDDTVLQFTSKQQLIGNVKLSEKYYQLDPKNISEWLEKAGVNEEEDITVMIDPARKRRDTDDSDNIVTFTLKDIGTPCQGIQTAGPSTSETESEIGTPIAISIGITFIVTAIAVGFFGIVVCIVLCSYSKKKKQENKSNGHWRVYNEERKTRL